MINLERVTITGADDKTNVNDLVALSKEFPFVEWGILVSKNRGDSRFPSLPCIDTFSVAAKANNLNVATHICGTWVRELFKGDLSWETLPKCFEVSQRVQLNTYGKPHGTVMMSFIEALKRESNKTFIFQLDTADRFMLAEEMAREPGIEVAGLFDESGGAGILPERWQPPLEALSCGYAGGLGPDNVFGQLVEISLVCKEKFWIDMEKNVRTNEDLDLAKVRAVLRLTKSIVEQVIAA